MKDFCGQLDGSCHPEVEGLWHFDCGCNVQDCYDSMNKLHNVTVRLVVPVLASNG